MNLMQWIVAKSLRFRYLVIFAAAILMLFGISQIVNLPVDVFPEFAPPKVEIQTPSIGLSSAEVESLVTVPLEEALNGIPGLDIMRSKSVEQLSSIVLIFETGTDLVIARQLVQERLSLAAPSLPTWAAPPVIMPPLSSTARTMKVGISSDKYSVMELSMITYWKIRERLLRVPGVANIAIWGEQIQMKQVLVDPSELAARGVSVDEIVQVTSDALDVGMVQYSGGSIVGTGGFLETPNQRLPIHLSSPVVTSEALASIPINDRTKADGSALRLGDVATMTDGTWPMIGDAVINDGPGLLLIVEKFPWANTLEVTNGVEAAFEEMRPGLEGIDIDTTIFRPATFIELALENLISSLLIGAGLVVLVLLLFLWDWRIALISATIIPLTVVITLLVLSLIGTTLNVMVLAGLVIALGAVVDDAIVDVENIVRRLREHRRAGSNMPTETIVLDASVEVRNAIVYASLIEMTALLPVFFLEGLSGAFFRPLAQAYVVATLVSPLVALTVTPALILVLLSNAPVKDRVSPIIPWLHRSYDSLLSRTLIRPRLAYVTTAALMAAGIIIWPLLGQELLPSFKERDFLMHWLTKPGTSHPEMVRISTEACKELREIPGVRNCGSHIGQALLMDEVYGIYFGENWISVDPSVDYDETLASVQSMVDGYPGLYRDVQTYLKERIREVLTGSSHPIVIRIFGSDLNVLREKAAEIEEKISQVDGLVEPHVELLLDIPQIQVEVDLAKAEQYGLKPGDVRRAAAYLMAGEEAGDIHTVNRTYDVQVWSTPETRRSVTDIEQLLIDTADGRQVRLSDVANVSIVPVPNAINHEGLARRINVEANVSGRDLGSVVDDVRDVLADIEYPLGYHAELLGEQAERDAAQQRILIAGAVAVMVIMVLLRVSLGNWRLAIMSFLSLPMALVGGVLAAYLASDGVLSLGSLVGFLTILGVAARNGIMLISHYQHLEEFEGEAFGPELVRRGAIERVAPIMMTALTAGLALVPLVVAGNIPGHEIEHPMSIVILGGLVTSTLVNLFIVPNLYLRFGKGKEQPPDQGVMVPA
ncbi:efflux RND transporter permease subunit [Promineifilum sp.]|uniref:efflux RND transporter permease subunit n=1 Tax=Promineifilum sp. TaxID=2664178 RepID=UPI0035B3861D